MLEFGIDELTVVLHFARRDILDDEETNLEFRWEDEAEGIINIFESRAGLIKVYGKRNGMAKLPQGYTFGWTYGEHAFYFAIAYHPYQMGMGVIVKFSAQAWAYYLEETGLKTYEALRRFCDDSWYKLTLSRIDLTADFIDMGIEVTQIYQDMIDGKLAIFREVEAKNGKLEYRKNPLHLQGFIKESEVPTIYLGSVQSESRLRIYDKRREQIERHGVHFDRAKSLHDWVRFEGVFRGKYAKQLLNALLSIDNDDDYMNLIACTFIQKFRFMETVSRDKIINADFMEEIVDCVKNKTYVLASPSSRNYDLAKSVRYLFAGSGVLATLTKIQKIWGDDELKFFLNYIYEYVQEYTPNDDCRYWMFKNVKDYQKKHPDFKEFLHVAVK